MISCSWKTAPLRTTARITAFRPGQSPPPVSMPMRNGTSHVSSCSILRRAPAEGSDAGCRAEFEDLMEDETPPALEPPPDADAPGTELEKVSAELEPLPGADATWAQSEVPKPDPPDQH